MLIRLDEVYLAMDKESTTKETSLDTRNSNIIPPFVQILEYKLPYLIEEAEQDPHGA